MHASSKPFEASRPNALSDAVVMMFVSWFKCNQPETQDDEEHNFMCVMQSARIKYDSLKRAGYSIDSHCLANAQTQP